MVRGVGYILVGLRQLLPGPHDCYFNTKYNNSQLLKYHRRKMSEDWNTWFKLRIFNLNGVFWCNAGLLYKLLIKMMQSGGKIGREEFLNAKYLKITVCDFQKNYLHHSRFVFEVITDRSKESVKKKYSEIKHFSDEIYQKFGMKEFVMENRVRNSKREEEVHNLFKKLNSGYLMMPDSSSQNGSQIKTQIRTCLYNLLYSDIEQLGSSEEEEQSSVLAVKGSTGKERVEEIRDERGRESTLPHKLRSIFKSKRDSEDFRKRDLLKNISSIWVRSEKGWGERLFKVSEERLVLYEKGDHSYKQIILLKYLNPYLVETDYYVIKLTHPLLKKAIQVRLSPLEDAGKEGREEYVNLLTVLRDACERGENAVCNFMGVCLSNKKNKFMVQPEKRPAQKLSVKLTHEGEVCVFSIGIDSSVYLQLPILNNYGKYECEVTEEKEAGLIPNLRENSMAFVLPVQNYYDLIYNQKPKRKVPEMRSHILESKQCNYSLRLEYFELTSWRSYCSGSPKDRFEGFEEPVEFSRDEFRIQKNRIKRILYSAEQLVDYLKRLKNCEYPLQSALFYLTLLLTVLLFDANSILQYILGALCTLIAYLHPAAHSYARDLSNLVVSSKFTKAVEGGLGERLWRPKFKVTFKARQEKANFLEKFSMRKKQKRNILEKYNRLQQILLRGQLFLTEFVTLSEKAKNLLGWYHHRKTQWLFLLCLALLLALFFIPLRLLALAALARVYLRGRTHHARVQQLNKLIVFELLRLIAEEEDLLTVREYLEDPLRPVDKKAQDYLVFERKVKERLSEMLKVDFDPALFAQARCLGQVMEWLSECRERFVVPQAVCRKYRFNPEWSRSSNSLTRFFLAVYQLLVNVPSDRNILETRQEEGEPREEDSEDQDLA